MDMKIKTGNDIAQYIYDDYIFNRDFSSKDEVLKNINLLIENGLAIKIAGSEFIDSTYRISKYRVASKFMIKYNKSLKHNKLDYENEYKFADINPKIIELMDYQLDYGTYYADLSKDDSSDYAMMIVTDPDESDEAAVKFEFYIIGHKCKKFKKKYFKMYNEYADLLKERKHEGITYSDNRPFKPAVFKSFDQMVFHDKDNIISYIDNWVKNIPEYAKYGMIPKLSILLYGEPGTGKSTFYKALANYLNIDTVRVMLPDYFTPSGLDTKRGRSFRSSYVAAIDVVDDIDCIAKSREEDDSNENGQVLSSLLEYLDNPPAFYYTAKDGLTYNISIVVATTNYYDRLDDAVKRYGRFDLKINMKPFNYQEAKEMCAIYNLGIKDVIKDIPDKKSFSISPAYLQALCMENIDIGLKKVGDKK